MPDLQHGLRQLGAASACGACRC